MHAGCRSIIWFVVTNAACQFYSASNSPAGVKDRARLTRAAFKKLRGRHTVITQTACCSEHVAVHKNGRGVKCREKHLSDDITCILMQQLKRLAPLVLRSPVYSTQPCFSHCTGR